MTMKLIYHWAEIEENLVGTWKPDVMGKRSTFNRPVVLAILIGAVLIAVGLAVGLAIGLRDDDDDNKSNSSKNGGSPSTATYKSSTGTYKYAAVVADSSVCSEIGRDILGRKRGNAIDAAVASAFCTGLLNAHSAGIGGGSFIIIYDSEKNEWHAINSRGTTSETAYTNMYVGEGGLDKSLNGGLASCIPGEVLGLWKIQRRLGKLPWADVVRPSTKLCQDGVPLTAAVHHAVETSLTSDKMKNDFAYYFDENNNVKPAGSLIKMPLLAETFQTIQDDPASFYNGSLAEKIVQDLKDEGGIISLDDLKNYKLKWTAPTVLPLPGGYTVYSIPAPGGGPALSYILNILAGYNMSSSNIADEENKILTYHRIIEAFKFAYGKRTEMGDEDFVDIKQLVKNMTTLAFGEATRALIDDMKTHGIAYYNPSAAITEDHGTTHISVLDGQGNAVSITGTINTYFGSRVKGSRTGVVFNNEMNDFSVPNTTNYYGLPPSPANFIEPGKRPMSSMCPAIVWDTNQNKVRMVAGGSGGSKITTATAMNIIDVLWLGRALPESVDNPRMHHQLFPDYVQIEEDFPQDIKDGLKAKGHEILPQTGISVLQAIDVTEDGIVGTADFRKGGQPRGF
ncbi:hypothetical protein RRG08_029599 [Elysia crispata]|uniref:Gamma-glutamyl transpeptidase n=1 Tax=Elysia crispata TaxID=231223 RepID=A0AAE0XP65_9GAST|nr:hypothetical protein RRG08_029599 [Elysia crispata]